MELKEILDSCSGVVNIQYHSEENAVLLSGTVATTDEKEFKKKIAQYVIDNYGADTKVLDNLVVNQGVVVNEDKVEIKGVDTERPLDEVAILYTGLVDIHLINPVESFKEINVNAKLKVDNCIRVCEVIAPIVLDKHFNVIDGMMRYELAKENDFTQVPVIVYNCDGIVADFLRLALNRSSEFQRWNYDKTDAYVDTVPQAQPLLEPLGFFGKTVLPESYFADSVIKYVVDPFNRKQAMYAQEKGLAEWAAFRREQMENGFKEKYAKAPKKSKKNVSLFKKVPTAADFLETYDAEAEMKNIVETWTENARVITEEFDAKRRPELEAKGQWQIKQKTTRKNTEDNRKNFMAKIISTNDLTFEQQQKILANVEYYYAQAKTIKDLKELLEKEG